MCPNKSMCDGFPEQCDSCKNNHTESGAHYTVNNVNIKVSGGAIAQTILLSAVLALLAPYFNNGSGKVHNITGAICSDTDSVYHITEMGKKA